MNLWVYSSKNARLHKRCSTDVRSYHDEEDDLHAGLCTREQMLHHSWAYIVLEEPGNVRRGPMAAGS